MGKRKLIRQNFVECDVGDIGTSVAGESTAPELVEDRIKQGKPVNQAMGGIFHTSPPHPFVTFNSATNEKRIGADGADIVFGQDRPTGLSSGFGFKGIFSPTIDLVVGRVSSAKDGEGPCEGMFVDNNFAADAARIYISRLTKVDTNFGIVRAGSGGSTPEPGRSGIVIKADKVRVIGREGVKIVTGKMQGLKAGTDGELNSVGGKIEQAPTIELIAGNYGEYRTVWGGAANMRERIEYLQPVIKGINMQDCIKELRGMLDRTLAMLQNFITTTITALGVIGIDPIRSWVPSGCSTSVQMAINYALVPVYTLQADLIAFEQNYLEWSGYKWICSKSVRTT
jgi:hypothetical protein